MRKLLEWLEEVRTKDFILPADAGKGAERRHEFVTADIPVKEIGRRIEELSRLYNSSEFTTPKVSGTDNMTEKVLIQIGVLSTNRRLTEFHNLKNV